MSVCMNCNTHGVEDMDVISHLIKIRLKPKVLLNHYMLCVRCGPDGSRWEGGRARGGELEGGQGSGRGASRREGGRVGGRSPHQHPLIRPVSRELLSAHKDNLGTTIKFVVFNELSNARNPNNMQILYTVLQHSSELAPKVGCSTARGASHKPGSPCGRGERRGEEHSAAAAAPGTGMQWVVWAELRGRKPGRA